MILAIRTDKQDAELYLYGSDHQFVDSYTWQAHRELSNTLLNKVDYLLDKNGTTQEDLSGLIVFQGPGSFTGLRIGITVANTLAYSLDIPIVGTMEDSWLTDGLQSLNDQTVPQIVFPEYGSDAHITLPRK